MLMCSRVMPGTANNRRTRQPTRAAQPKRLVVSSNVAHDMGRRGHEGEQMLVLQTRTVSLNDEAFGRIEDVAPAREASDAKGAWIGAVASHNMGSP